MIDREKVLALIGVAHIEGQTVELKPSELDELGRVYLAWLDAPDAKVEYEVGSTIGAKITGGPIGSQTCPIEMLGKHVRLVEVK